MPRRRLHSFNGRTDWTAYLGENQEIELVGDVSFDFSPEEPMVRYYRDGSGYPGSPAMIEFNPTARLKQVTIEIGEQKVVLPIDSKKWGQAIFDELVDQQSLERELLAEIGEPDDPPERDFD